MVHGGGRMTREKGSPSGRPGTPILLVSWTVFPAPSGSSFIVSNLAREFEKDEMLLVGEKPARARPEDWPVDAPEIVHLGRRFWPRKGGRFLRWLRWFYFPVLVWRLDRLAREMGAESVVAVFPDEYYMLAAYLVARRRGLPFLPWFHNTFLENRSGLRRRLANRLQPRFFSAADRVLVISDGMAEALDEIYPETQFVPLVHGFDLPPSLPEPADFSMRPLRLVFTGHLNASCFDATARLARVLVDRDDVELHTYSSTSESIFARAGLRGDNVIHHGIVPLDRLMREIAASHVNILPHGLEGARSDVEFRTIFPTRTIPLLYSGRPILAHSPPDSFLTRFLRERDCALIVDQPDEARIERALERIAHDESCRDRLVRNAWDASRLFDVRRVADRLRDLVAT